MIFIFQTALPVLALPVLAFPEPHRHNHDPPFSLQDAQAGKFETQFSYTNVMSSPALEPRG